MVTKNVFVEKIVKPIQTEIFKRRFKYFIQKGDVKKLKDLISQEKELFNSVKFKRSPLLHRILKSEKLTLEQKNQLINSTSIDATKYQETDYQGKTLLHRAVLMKAQESERLISSLVQKGVAIDAQDSQGATALHYASSVSNQKAARELVKNNANVNLEDNNGNTPLHYAANSSNEQTIDILIQNGANIDAQNIYGNTALYYATTTNNSAVAIKLIDSGANVNLPNKRGNTPLHYASRFDRTELAIKLMDSGADLSLQDSNGNNALHFAAASGNNRLIEELLNRGADTNVQNNSQQTPLDVAREKKHEISQTLLISKEEFLADQEKISKQNSLNTNGIDTVNIPTPSKLQTQSKAKSNKRTLESQQELPREKKPRQTDTTKRKKKVTFDLDKNQEVSFKSTSPANQIHNVGAPNQNAISDEEAVLKANRLNAMLARKITEINTKSSGTVALEENPSQELGLNNNAEALNIAGNSTGQAAITLEERPQSKQPRIDTELAKAIQAGTKLKPAKQTAQSKTSVSAAISANLLSEQREKLKRVETQKSEKSSTTLPLNESLLNKTKKVQQSKVDNDAVDPDEWNEEIDIKPATKVTPIAIKKTQQSVVIPEVSKAPPKSVRNTQGNPIVQIKQRRMDISGESEEQDKENKAPNKIGKLSESQKKGAVADLFKQKINPSQARAQETTTLSKEDKQKAKEALGALLTQNQNPKTSKEKRSSINEKRAGYKRQSTIDRNW